MTGWAVLAMVAGMLLAACSVGVTVLVLEQVDAKLPRAERSPVTRLRFWEVLRLHRQMYPRDRKRVILFGTTIMGAALLITAWLVMAPAIVGWP